MLGQSLCLKPNRLFTMDARLVVLMLMLGSMTAGCMEALEDFQDGDGPQPICPDGEPCTCTDVDENCEDGDDDWGYWGRTELFYCSNDGADYAEGMGGISCDAEESTFPVCPDGEDCFCIDVDESCDDGDDDWGYIGEGWIFYCSYDGTFYAEMMGGINCADSALGFVGEDDGEDHEDGNTDDDSDESDSE